MGTGTSDEVDTQEEEEDNEEIDDFEFQVRPNSSKHENEASTNMQSGYSDWFGALRNLYKTIDGMQRSSEIMTTTNLVDQSGKYGKTGSGNTPAEPEADYEKNSSQRGKTCISTSTKLPRTNR